MFISEKIIITDNLETLKKDIESVATLEQAIESSNINDSEDPDVVVLASMLNSILEYPVIERVEAALMWAISIEAYEDEGDNEEEEEEEEY